MKKAEALLTNLKDMVHGQELYADPPGREAHSEHSPWGEPGLPDPNHNGEALWQQYNDVRYGVLGREFSNLRRAAEVDRKLIRENFNAQKYDSHSALLSLPGLKTAAMNSLYSPTLSEQVKKILG